MKTLTVIAAFGLASVASAAPSQANLKKFEQLHALMQPTAEELVWQQIPWQTNLWDARVEAAKTGKPIYLWEMDGHPLGCT